MQSFSMPGAFPTSSGSNKNDGTTATATATATKAATSAANTTTQSRLDSSQANKLSGFETINDKVLREMNERAKNIVSTPLPPSSQKYSPPRRKKSLATAATAAATAARTPKRGHHKRYSSVHRRNFAKMDSISDHYSAHHPARTREEKERQVNETECNNDVKKDIQSDKRTSSRVVTNASKRRRMDTSGRKVELRSSRSRSNLAKIAASSSPAPAASPEKKPSLLSRLGACSSSKLSTAAQARIPTEAHRAVSAPSASPSLKTKASRSNLSSNPTLSSASPSLTTKTSRSNLSSSANSSSSSSSASSGPKPDTTQGLRRPPLLASSERVEQMLNQLPPPPTSLKTDSDKTAAKTLRKSPSVANIKTPRATSASTSTSTTNPTSKIPTLKASTYAAPTQSSMGRLAKSREMAKSSPNLKSLSSRQSSSRLKQL